MIISLSCYFHLIFIISENSFGPVVAVVSGFEILVTLFSVPKCVVLHAGAESFLILSRHDVSAPLLVLLVCHIIQLKVQVTTQRRILLQLHLLLHLFFGESNLLVESLILVVHIPCPPLAHSRFVGMSHVLLHELSFPILHLLHLMVLVQIFVVLLLLRFLMFIVGLSSLDLMLQILENAFHDMQILLLFAGKGYVFVVFGQIVGYLVEVLAH